MKRRSFLQFLAGLVGAPALPSLSSVASRAPPGEALFAASYPIRIDQLRSPGIVATMAPVQAEANAIWRASLERELLKDTLAARLVGEHDKALVQALTGKNSKA